MSDPYEAILDRDFALDAAAQFEPSTSLLREIINYGTALIPRCYLSGQKDLKDICLLFVLLRQFLVHLDGFSLTAGSGNTETADLQLRSLWEISITMAFLLQNDTESKAQHIYVAHLRGRRDWNSTVIPGTQQHSALAACGGAPNATAEHIRLATEENKQINTLLSQPPLDAFDAKFSTENAKRGFDPSWYQFFGMKNLRMVAEAVGRLREYKVFYKSFSSVAHGSGFWKSVLMSGGKVEVTPVRTPQEIGDTIKVAVNFSLVVYRLILKEYRPAEIPNFDRKYVTEWRQRHFQQYDIRINPQPVTI